MKGIKLIQAHNANCGMFNGLNGYGSPWCLPTLEYLDLRRDTSKRKHAFKDSWLTFQCSDPGCNAKLAMTWREVEARLSLNKPELAHLGAIAAKRLFKRLVKEGKWPPPEVA